MGMRSGHKIPLMEEEVLVVREKSVIIFDVHKRLYNELLKGVLSKLKPLAVREEGERVVVELRDDEGEELRAWLLLNLDKGFFITELESLDLA